MVLTDKRSCCSAALGSQLRLRKSRPLTLHLTSQSFEPWCPPCLPLNSSEKQSGSFPTASKRLRHKVRPSLSQCLNAFANILPVTHILAETRRPSPPSTLLLASPSLALATTPEVRTSLIRRCLRYVSHGPWGSVWAEANGEREAFERIARRLWPSPTSEPQGNEEGEDASVTQDAEGEEVSVTQDGEGEEPSVTQDGRQSFTAGAGVVATPVCILQDDTIRLRPAKDGELGGWILLREPHYRYQGGQPGTGGVLDVTDEIMDAMRTREKTRTVLYDNRFTVRFSLDLLPRTVEEELVKRAARVLIEPDTKWALPKITLVGKRTTQRCIGKYLWYIHGWSDTRKRPVKLQRWITMDFVRSLDAI